MTATCVCCGRRKHKHNRRPGRLERHHLCTNPEVVREVCSRCHVILTEVERILGVHAVRGAPKQQSTEIVWSILVRFAALVNLGFTGSAELDPQTRLLGQILAQLHLAHVPFGPDPIASDHRASKWRGRRIATPPPEQRAVALLASVAGALANVLEGPLGGEAKHQEFASRLDRIASDPWSLVDQFEAADPATDRRTVTRALEALLRVARGEAAPEAIAGELEAFREVEARWLGPIGDCAP